MDGGSENFVFRSGYRSRAMWPMGMKDARVGLLDDVASVVAVSTMASFSYLFIYSSGELKKHLSLSRVKIDESHLTAGYFSTCFAISSSLPATSSPSFYTNNNLTISPTFLTNKHSNHRGFDRSSQSSRETYSPLAPSPSTRQSDPGPTCTPRAARIAAGRGRRCRDPRG